MHLLFWWGPLLGYGIRAGQLGIQDLVRDRHLAAHDPTLLRDVKPGLVLVRGRVRLLERPLESGLFRVPCVAFTVRRRNHRSVSMATSFLLQDDSGTAKVLPSKVSL